MDLKEFTQKLQTHRLYKIFQKEIDFIECRCETAVLDKDLYLFRLIIQKSGRSKESIDFHIFFKKSLFDHLTVILPRDASIDQIDQLLEISKIVEEHVKSAFSEKESEILNLKDVYDLIDEFNDRTVLSKFDLKIEIVENRWIKLFVPMMHPHQKQQEFTIAVIDEHTIEDLILIMKTQIRAIDLYKELLYREDFVMVQFELSSKYRLTIDVILKDDLTANERVRVRMIDQDFIEVTCSISYVTSNSEYVEISDKNSQIVYKVSSNDDYDKRDYLIETATSQRCPLKDFSKTLSDVRFRLKDRIIRITPVAD